MSNTSSEIVIDIEPNILGRWERPKITEAELDWADILTVDLSLFDVNRTELVRTVAAALERDGFFYVVGHGIDVETVRPHKYRSREIELADGLQLDRQFDLGQLTFDGVDYAEKVKHKAKIAEEGSFNGYKVSKLPVALFDFNTHEDIVQLQNFWEIKDGVRDRIEHYNFYLNQ